jgi:tetratricopeptide (TPR) repeat protein
MTPLEASISRDPLTLAIAAHEKAIALHASTRLPAAEAACRRAVELYEQAEGADHPDVANALVELGQILEASDQPRPARDCHAKAIAILGRPQANEDPDLTRLRLHARSFVAGLDRALGAYAAADRGFQAALREATRVLGPDDLFVASMINNLGVLRKAQGRYADAVRYYKRALPILERAGDRIALATLYHNLGGIEHARGRYAAGEPWARKSVETREAELGSDHVAVAADVAALAAIIEGLGRLDEAAALYERALHVFRRKLGPVNTEVALNLSGLASLRQQQGRTADAERLFAEALPMMEKLFGRDHAEVGLTVHNLAFLERAQGRTARAIALYERALRIFQRTLGARHPHTRLCAANLRETERERRKPAPRSRGAAKRP